MDDVFAQLWQHYLDSCFLLSQPLSSSLPFAIITAHNPLGQVLEPCQNRLRDRALQGDIEQLLVPYRIIIGTAADLSHMEKSWAVFVSKVQAAELAKKYQQNAFYYVADNVLSLVPCLAGVQEQQIGDFRQRVRIVSELPEICD
ncbi:DUF3293 domain-containing protein [Shewanella dokdonensis]|uniref:DUF3293 domain-containing protein n=1 Tax=Shewanella dokdonensis TaxID=712036 RepID=A0ABX8DC65_9GAMM|nr:DUF3293 domain-containing protein [Shewanella dokdonensis]MCL1074637.1 DUF3293 domain-containing protein [Shewanella dokdonensis]QVK22365.1 DUF3293 domain-containing protein [Shewanella dokdonensis]